MMDTHDIQFFEVGGAVRDRLMGVDPADIHDVDFTVVAPSFGAMVEHLTESGFSIWQVREEHLTVRAGVPADHPLRERTRDADFVMARLDGTYSDGRRPDFVKPGTLLDDLARRDFTVNAMALGPDGEIIDPHGGRADLETMTLRFVGNPAERIAEDGLRVIRALRFMSTKGFTPSPSTETAMRSPEAVDMLAGVSINRISDELTRMFEHDSIGALLVIQQFPEFLQVIFRDGLHLATSLKKLKKAPS